MKILIVILFLAIFSPSFTSAGSIDLFPTAKEFHLRYEPPEYMINFISQFRGVEHVFKTDRYTVYVSIGDAFNWGEIIYEIESILAQRGYLGL